MAGKGSSRAMRWRHAVAESNLASTTKHVLVELHSFMNSLGQQCFPTQETLARRTSLSIRAVRDHLKIAETVGWIEIQGGRFEGARNAQHSYFARWPDEHRQMTTEAPANGD